jgi:hypothetical protein
VTGALEVSEEDGVVTVGSQKLEGWIHKNGACPTCVSPTIYYEKYDAVFCPQCNQWLESQCGDPGCCYCPRRPDRPIAGGPDRAAVSGAMLRATHPDRGSED